VTLEIETMSVTHFSTRRVVSCASYRRSNFTILL